MVVNRYFKIIFVSVLIVALLGSSYWIGFAGDQGEVEVLQQDLAEAKIEVEELKQQVSQFDKVRDENDQLKSRLEDRESQVKDFEETIEELEEKIDLIENGLSTKEPEPDGSKKVFLTFDDGPTAITEDIVDTLNDYDVNGTFFTVGQRMEESPEISQRTYEEGNMILTHSYTHDYSIYESLDSFYEDLRLAEEAYENVLGFEAPQILRFPGGSSNHSSFNYGGEEFMTTLTEDIKDRGYHYIDWNVTSGDASDIYDQPDEMLKQIKATSADRDLVVPLFHDTARNEATAEILPEVIEFYKEEGYEFRTFADITDEELNEMMNKQIADKPVVR
ncbi:polysaccharide deacetylase family protein [Alteribacter populi]|uniref:polysaccharide deacetylase family protein n=1 Tax=Alteribacter populi TaxID=2011011 RepID=UPI000BBAE1F9|nr:polysaccharide deacetylase family protein [Alteribacter populi]